MHLLCYIPQHATNIQNNIDYNHLIDRDEFTILYHIFSRINNIESWIEICNDLGFDKYFCLIHFKEFYSMIRKLEVRARDQNQNQLRFFMQLIIYYWDNLTITNNDAFNDDFGDDEHSNFANFWMKCLSKMTKVSYIKFAFCALCLSITWNNHASKLPISLPLSSHCMQYTFSYSSFQS